MKILFQSAIQADTEEIPDEPEVPQGTQPEIPTPTPTDPIPG